MQDTNLLFGCGSAVLVFLTPMCEDQSAPSSSLTKKKTLSDPSPRPVLPALAYLDTLAFPDLLDAPLPSNIIHCRREVENQTCAGKLFKYYSVDDCVC